MGCCFGLAARCFFVAIVWLVFIMLGGFVVCLIWLLRSVGWRGFACLPV